MDDVKIKKDHFDFGIVLVMTMKMLAWDIVKKTS